MHDLASPIRTSVRLAAQGWRDQDDAAALPHFLPSVLHQFSGWADATGEARARLAADALHRDHGRTNEHQSPARADGA
jgi:hypothetical protein